MLKDTPVKIFSLIVLCVFLFACTAGGFEAPALIDQNYRLAAEIISQKKPLTGQGMNKQIEIFRESSLAGSILSIAEYLLTDLSDEANLEYLEGVMRSEINEHLTGIDISRVKKEDDIIIIPYRYDDANYIIQAALRGTQAADKTAGTDLDISDKYAVKVLRRERTFFTYGNITEGPAHIAHRITSLKDVDLAVNSGKAMIEFDVQLTRDDVPVIYWGKLDLPDVDRKYIRQYTVSELEREVTGRISRVKDVLKKAKGRIAVQFDIKDWAEDIDTDYGEKVLDVLDNMIRKYDMSGDIYVAGFNQSYIKRFKEINPSVSAGISMPDRVKEKEDIAARLEQMIEFAKDNGIEVIALYPEQLNDGLIERIHAEGLKLAVNAGSDIEREFFMKADMVYVEKKDINKRYPRIRNGRDLLGMKDEEILGLMKPEYGELLKHTRAVWKYARVIAKAMGIEEESREMNMLRVICLGHDIGGVLGFRHDQRLEQGLLNAAGKRHIPYMRRDIKRIIADFAAEGIDLEKEYQQFVRTMDHGSNSVRIMKEQGISVPPVVASVIIKHMGLPDDSEKWIEKEKLLFSIFVMGDIFDCGNNYYKQAGGYDKHAGKFESPEDTLHFIKYIKFKKKENVSFEYLDDVLAVVSRLVESRDPGFMECIDYSRTPIAETDINRPDVFAFDLIEDEVNNRWAETVTAANDVIEYSGTVGIETAPCQEELSIFSPVDTVKRTVDIILTRLKDGYVSGLPEKIQRSLNLLRLNNSYIETDSIITSLIVLGRRAKNREEELIIGLGTDWIPEYKSGSLQHSVVNPVMRELLTLGDTLKKLGLDNVNVVCSEGKELARKIENEAEQTGTSFRNIVVLASEDIIESENFDRLRSTAYEQRAFLAGIDTGMLDSNKVPAGKMNYIDIIKMLSITLELARGKTAGGALIIKKYMPLARKVIFLPGPEPLDYEQIKRRRDNNLYALRSA